MQSKLSSYVPEWHKYENHKELYACNKDLGGEVILTECHEIDILSNIFGEPLDIEIKKPNKKLKLDVRYRKY